MKQQQLMERTRRAVRHRRAAPSFLASEFPRSWALPANQIGIIRSPRLPAYLPECSIVSWMSPTGLAEKHSHNPPFEASSIDESQQFSHNMRRSDGEDIAGMGARSGRRRMGGNSVDCLRVRRSDRRQSNSLNL